MKALIALLIAAMIGLIGFGGYYVYTQVLNPLGKAEQVDAAEESSAAPGTVSGGRKKKPANQADILDNLDAATKMNNDTVAWLKIPGTDINDSVLQAIDNRYYLRRDEAKKDNIYGCYFADYECPMGSRGEYAANTVIYGHSDLKDDPDGPRFSQLFRFTQKEFAEKTPYIYLTAPEEKTTWQVFAAFYTDTGLDYINAHLAPEKVTALANEAKKLAVFDYGVDVSGKDKILTLSTCSVKYGTDGSERFVVMAKLLPEGTKEEKKVTLGDAKEAGAAGEK